MAVLMAPGGTLQMAAGALDHGADSVYVGPHGWSRRPASDELSDAEIRELIEHGRSGGKDVRIAINVMPAPDEIGCFLDKVGRYAAWGAGGVMLCDPGCIRLVRERVPGIEIHVSVTAGLFNSEDIRVYRQLGADHVVLPYRWGSAEIAEAKGRTGIALEAFLFETPQRSWICPGRCHASSYFRIDHACDEQGKDHFVGSAGRGGSCHRICQGRWNFRSGTELLTGARQLKSSPELLLWELPDYVEVGVSRFKIPGRERSVELVCAITAFYRRALDHVLRGSRDLSGFLPEWSDIKARWVSERSHRDDRRVGAAAA